MAIIKIFNETLDPLIIKDDSIIKEIPLIEENPLISTHNLKTMTNQILKVK